MTFLLLLVIAAFTIVITYFLIQGEDFLTAFCGGGLIAFATFLIVSFCIILPLSHIFGGKFEVKYKESTTEILSLQDTTHQIFLRRGYAKDELKYNYMYATDKGYTVGSTPAENSYINYTDGVPYIYCKEPQCYKSFLANVFLIVDSCNHPSEYYFYIPQGSIIEDYSIDLK